MALSFLRHTTGKAPQVSRLLVGRFTASQTWPTDRQISLTPNTKKRIYAPVETQHPERQHWLNERYVAVAMFPIIPLGIAFPHPIMDTVLCGTMILHVHWRLKGVAEDYIHGEILPRIAQPLVSLLTVIAFGSICYFNYTDIGFANAVRMIYTKL